VRRGAMRCDEAARTGSSSAHAPTVQLPLLEAEAVAALIPVGAVAHAAVVRHARAAAHAVTVQFLASEATPRAVTLALLPVAYAARVHHGGAAAATQAV